MVGPITIDANGKEVVVKLMDDSWIINRCAGAHPFKPTQGIFWSHSEHCCRLPIPGDEFPDFMSQMCDTYGNCAAIARHNDMVLGHIVFLPRAVARKWQATGFEHFGPATDDERTLVVINLAFCSLSGHEFRNKGVGKALVGIMVGWARENGWKQIEVYDTGPGLFPVEWYDYCIPPKPFWESRGFFVFAKRKDETFSNQSLKAIIADNPRNSSEEQQQKEQILQNLERGVIDPTLPTRRYDLLRNLQA